MIKKAKENNKKTSKWAERFLNDPSESLSTKFERISNESFSSGFLDTIEQIHYSRVVADDKYDLPEINE